MSNRSAGGSVGWATLYELEDLLLRYLDAKIIAPVPRADLNGHTKRVRDRIFSDVRLSGQNPLPGDILLVVAGSPGELNRIRAYGKNLRVFDAIFGYVIDSYFLNGYPTATSMYDHIFCNTNDGIDYVQREFGVPTTLLRIGTDVLRWYSTRTDRSIDVIGYGRQPLDMQYAFQTHFHTSSNTRLYLHSPIGNRDSVRGITERPMLLKLLQRSKISLAFDLKNEDGLSRPRAPIVTNRWLESLAAGCIVAGKRPFGDMADELLSWTDATVELPQNPRDAINMIESILKEDTWIKNTRERNVRNMRSQHDWRYRILTIARTLGLSTKQELHTDLELLRNDNNEGLREEATPELAHF